MPDDLSPNPETQNPIGEAADPEGLDAAAEAFAQKAQTQPEDQEAEPEGDAEGESDEEAQEAEPAEDEPTENVAEVEYEGKTYKVPSELREALLRQSDYSRNMNEVKAKEKAYTEGLQRIEAVTEGAQKYAEALAGVRLIESQLKALESVDIDALENENPNEAARLAVRQLKLQRQLDAAIADAQQASNKVSTEKAELFAKAREEMVKALQKDLKGWGDELGVKLTQYAESNGVQRKTLEALTDPAIVVLMDKARRFDELQASKPALKAKAKDAPPVVKPGAPRPRVDARSESLARLRKSNSIDDAAAAFLARG